MTVLNLDQRVMIQIEEKDNCLKAGSFGKKQLDTPKQQKKLALQVQKRPTNWQKSQIQNSWIEGQINGRIQIPLINGWTKYKFGWNIKTMIFRIGKAWIEQSFCS